MPLAPKPVGNLDLGLPAGTGERSILAVPGKDLVLLGKALEHPLGELSVRGRKLGDGRTAQVHADARHLAPRRSPRVCQQLWATTRSVVLRLLVVFPVLLIVIPVFLILPLDKEAGVPRRSASLSSVTNATPASWPQLGSRTSWKELSRVACAASSFRQARRGGNRPNPYRLLIRLENLAASCDLQMAAFLIIFVAIDVIGL